MDWYPWYYTIYELDTMHLNPYQDGCYRRLIDHYMKTRAPLPDNDAALSRIIGDSVDNWVVLAATEIRKFFTPKNGHLHLRRCDDVLTYQDAKSKKLSESGKKGAKIRHSQPIENNDVSSHPKATIKPPLSPAVAQVQVQLHKEDSFAVFWKGFPRDRIGNKDKAKSAYVKALTRATEEEILNGLEKYRRSSEVASGYAKGAAAWLNDDRWASDYRTPGEQTTRRSDQSDMEKQKRIMEQSV